VRKKLVWLMMANLLWFASAGCAGGHANIVVARGNRVRPILLDSEENPGSQADLGCQKADGDAQAATCRAGWFTAGLIGNAMGIAGSYLYEPSVKWELVKNTDREYIRCYTECYVDSARGENQFWAWMGLVTFYGAVALSGAFSRR
jgi:hypothetical protein